VPARILVLGAGVGALEPASVLSEKLGDDAGVTPIDRPLSRR
jgi:NADH dehydrogenase FAD-containing subunit